jgi:microcystin-dependent protein
MFRWTDYQIILLKTKMPTIPKIISDFTTQLASAIAVGGTTGTIASNVDDDSVTLPDGLYYFTIDGNNSNKEHISCTKTGSSLSAIKSVSRQGVETSGAVRAHRVGALVVMTDFATYKNYIDATSLQGAANATTTVAGVARLSAAPTDPAVPIAVGTNDVKLPTADPTTLFLSISALVGVISPYAGRSAPAGFLMCDGAAVSRSTYAALFGVICPSQSYTASSASPTVITATAHGLAVGDKVHFTTNTGGRGIAAGTEYYVTSVDSADAFKISLTPAGANINTTGTEGGTLYKSAYGVGDGSTTFNVPDLRARMPVGLAATAPTTVLKFQDSQVNTGTDVVTILDTVFPSQGQTVVLSTTGTLPGGLSPGTYYVIRASATTIKFASSQANANTGTAIDITSAAGGGVHSMTFTNRTHTVLGRNGGEEAHGSSISEMASHTHGQSNWAMDVPHQNGSGASAHGTSNNLNQGAMSTIDNTGGDALHNVMQPFTTVNYIIKY